VEDDQDWDLCAFYERYLQRCNEHRFDELGEFVAADVRVNDRPQGLEQYVAGLRAMVSAFPDYRWNLRRLFVEGPWLSAYFTDTAPIAAPSSGCRRRDGQSARWSSPSTGSPRERSPTCG
jgi:predicted ester cyclase